MDWNTIITQHYMCGMPRELLSTIYIVYTKTFVLQTLLYIPTEQRLLLLLKLVTSYDSFVHSMFLAFTLAIVNVVSMSPIIATL